MTLHAKSFLAIIILSISNVAFCGVLLVRPAAAYHQPKEPKRMSCHQYSNHQDAPIVDRRQCGSILKAGGLSLLLPAAATLGTATSPVLAMDDLPTADEKQRMAFNQRPRAPLSVLLPATEQRTLLKECLELVMSIESKGAERGELAATQRLESILENPKEKGGGNYNYYTKGLTEKKRTERDLRILSQYQQSQSRRLSGNIVRAAMNIYISNLRYGRDYTVEDTDWKSSYIRANDGLPDFRMLIQADLDLRILYMNQVQIRVDDAAAEFYAALLDGNDGDFDELLRLLRLANDSMDAWFQLIEDVDVAEAASAIERGTTIKLAENAYMAGFIPSARE